MMFRPWWPNFGRKERDQQAQVFAAGPGLARSVVWTSYRGRGCDGEVARCLNLQIWKKRRLHGSTWVGTTNKGVTLDGKVAMFFPRRGAVGGSPAVSRGRGRP